MGLPPDVLPFVSHSWGPSQGGRWRGASDGLAEGDASRQRERMAPTRSLRSALFVPAASNRALAKSSGLGADALLFDLEDSVAPEAKERAREDLRDHLAGLRAGPRGARRIVRINAFSGPFGTEDFLMARGAADPSRGGVGAILLPKVESVQDVSLVAEALAETDAPADLRLWAMIETPKGILAAEEIARSSARLEALVVGPNDIVAATGLRPSPGRPELVPWLMRIVLAAKAEGLAVLDGVFNDYRDAEGLAAECAAARAMGFDGKTLIHPSQIEPANHAFAPSAAETREARAIIAAFGLPENAGRGVVGIDGRMVERLHLAAAERIVALAEAIETFSTRREP
ncbi:MAG: CoA ester lyase [Rhizobiaceae bacterium]|nr:CoA ester lyase [Rhizobiaceae bacterium]